ncbi:MAG: SRPBCC family protein [Gemmatimonadota bacterium]
MTATKPSYVYVTYIVTTPEKVWQALVDVDMMRQYWVGVATGPARANVSDWKVGSRWEHQRMDGTATVDMAGTVLEIEPPRRLVMSWARPAEEADPSKHGKLTFEVEPQPSGVVRLTILHEDLDEKMHAGISNGWPMILSNLKTLLETGHPLPRAAAAS